MKNALLLFTLLLSGSGLMAQTLKPEFLWELGRVSDPQISPDGKEVLYSVRTYDLAANQGNSNIWKVNMATGESVAVADGASNESSAKWSADGKKIFYLDDQGGASTLWSMTPDGGSKAQEIKLAGDINAYGIAPNGSRRRSRASCAEPPPTA